MEQKDIMDTIYTTDMMDKMNKMDMIEHINNLIHHNKEYANKHVEMENEIKHLKNVIAEMNKHNNQHDNNQHDNNQNNLNNIQI
jgi:hypothetical protein